MALLAILNGFFFIVFKIGNGWLEKNCAFYVYLIIAILQILPLLLIVFQVSTSVGFLINTYNSFKLFTFPYFNSLAKTNRTMVLKRKLATAGIFSCK